MWRRWINDLSVELHWMKRDIIRRWRLDTSTGIMGILTLISGLLLFVVIGDGIAHIFRLFVPFVSGTRIGEVYWQSIGFGIKISFIFMIFSGSLIILFLLKFFERR
ncbi:MULTISPECIES: hypothetical protein [unclassified Desulfosporosinus]|uniref:hypothetical protein n=1 Tax=unclassified Desulfosporosinus TaxID=2633794 RepID=UPI0002239EC1|nr:MULTISPECIES: hypothetical protein [unclassified Desulfosporosinus]EGW37331.1 hypothetical protein DOT_4873 [Desulfosporosinus sp. OT]ODA39790.1 hypothetical protein DSBG_3456 [Desulfosporosinus sp. BG]